MKALLPVVACAAALSLPAFAHQVEAMKHGDPRAESVAQARVAARVKIPVELAVQPEAERSFNARAAAVAENRKAQRLQRPDRPADQARAIQQYQKL